MNNLKTIFMTLFILAAPSLLAQINVEKFRGKDSINLSLAYTDSDTKTTATNTFLFNFLASKTVGEHEFLAVAGTTVSEKNDEEFKNTQFFHLRYFRNMSDWGPEAFYQYASNDFSNQRERQLLGAGIRKIITKENYSLRGGLSLLHEELLLATRIEEVTIEEDLDMTRLSTYLNMTQKYLSITVYYQPNVDQIEEHNLALESLLTFDLWKERVKLDFIYNITKNKTLDIENSKFMQVIRIKW